MIDDDYVNPNKTNECKDNECNKDLSLNNKFSDESKIKKQ